MLRATAAALAGLGVALAATTPAAALPTARAAAAPPAISAAPPGLSAATGASAVHRFALADGTRDLQWYLSTLRIPRAHQVTRGAGVVVAVIDSGVDGTHPDLVDAVLPGADVTKPGTGGIPGAGGTPVPSTGQADADGRGTALAGVIAGRGHRGIGGPTTGATGPRPDGILGIAPEAKILPIVFAPNAGDFGNPDTLATGIDEAVRRGAQVICVGRGLAGTPRLRAAVAAATSRGVVVVAAREQLPYPADYDGVLAAISTTRAGTRVGTDGDGLAVPGNDIVSTNTRGGYRIDSTGSAAAVLAGIVALVRAAHPSLPGDEIVHRLTTTARDGVPDVDAALTRVIPLKNPPPTATPGGAVALRPTATAAADGDGSAPAFGGGNWRRWFIVVPILLFFAGLVAVTMRTSRRETRRTR